jgi:capsular polysaccharide biosynthesis protein
VIKKLGDRLEGSDRDVVRLMSKVKGSVAPKSDSIEINVTHEDPKLAAAIANAWGTAYVTRVNNIYSGGGLRESYEAIQRQTQEAFQAYEQAQAELAAFQSGNRVQELARQIAEQQMIVDNLSAARTLLVNTVVSDTMVAQLTVFDEQIHNLEERLALAYADSRQINQWLKDAQDMRDQVLKGGEGAASSNAIALSLLKAQVFATLNRVTAGDASSGVNNNLQIQAVPAELTAEEMVEDLNSLISTLEVRQTSLETEIQALSQQLLESRGNMSALSLNALENPEGRAIEGQAAVQSFSAMKGLEGVLSEDPIDSDLEQKIIELEEKINQLESQSVIETAREQYLIGARDLAWEIYLTIAKKEAELKVSAETTGTDVVLAAPAAVPVRPVNAGSREIEIAALVGLVLGIVSAFAIEYWWRYKGYEPQPVITFPSRRKKKPEE